MGHTLSEVSELIDVPYRTCASWVKLVRPGYKGRQRVQVEISEKELREFRILAKLRYQLSMQSLRKAMAYLRALGQNPLSRGTFAVIETKGPRKRRLVKISQDESEAYELIGKERGQLFLIPLWDEPIDG